MAHQLRWIGSMENSMPTIESIEREISGDEGRKGYCLVPGVATQSLSDSEKGSFLFGLYCFSKNFVQLKKFIESKSMGDIQAYYYGEFHKTREYLRWSGRRMIRTRRCVVGHNLLTAVRQQELFSRIQRHLSDESKHAVLEAVKRYEDEKKSFEGKMDDEEKIAFEKFIFSLKSVVGAAILVEAGAIGRTRAQRNKLTDERKLLNFTGSTLKN